MRIAIAGTAEAAEARAALGDRLGPVELVDGGDADGLVVRGDPVEALPALLVAAAAGIPAVWDLPADALDPAPPWLAGALPLATVVLTPAAAALAALAPSADLAAPAGPGESWDLAAAALAEGPAPDPARRAAAATLAGTLARRAAALERELGDLAARAAAAEAERGQAASEAAQLEEQVGDQSARAAAAAADRDAARAAAARLEEALAAARADAAAWRERAEQAVAALGRVGDDVGAERERAEAVREEAAALRAQLARQRARADEAVAEAARAAAREEQAREVRERLREAERRLSALSGRREVRLALGAAEALRPARAAARRVLAAAAAAPARSRRRPRRARPATAEERDELGARILAALPPPAGPPGPRVQVLVRRSGAEALERCLRALTDTGYRALDVTVTDAPLADAPGDAPLVLALDDEVEPIGIGWLASMVRTLAGTGAAAVGPVLVDRADLTVAARGIGLRGGDGVPAPHPLGAGEDPLPPGGVRDVPVLPRECLLVRRDALAVAARDGDHVDLCLALRAAGHSVAVDGGAVAWCRAVRPGDPARVADRWGPQAFREVFLDRLAGTGAWSEDPPHVAITVALDDPRSGPEWETAARLGAAVARLGWRVTLAERHAGRWYRLPAGVDVVVSLLDDFDVTRAPAGAVTVAWVHGGADRWAARPWFGDHDLVLATSRAAQEHLERAGPKRVALLPLAADPGRFRPDHDAGPGADVLVVADRGDAPAALEAALPGLVAAGLDVRLQGAGWDALPALAPLARGALPPDRLPAAYAAARLVLHADAGARAWDAVPAAVLDAMAAGTLVVTDAAAARDLVDDDVAVWDPAEDPAALVTALLADPGARAALADRHRRAVLARHTAAARALALRELLADWARAERIGVLAGVPTRAEAPRWGDTAFARDLQRQLERRGHPTRVLLLPEWRTGTAARCDAVVHLFGLSDWTSRPAQVSVLWNISHPDLVTPARCDAYDLVLAASARRAAELAPRTATPVAVLAQATDPERFLPDPTGPAHALLFVGNSRRARRRILADLLPTRHDLAVYGRNWTPDLIDPRHVRGDHVPNDELHRWYASAAIVLNDHWEDMRAAGYLSNRLYDALAAGAFVISDHVEGIEEAFDGGVVTYRDRVELAALVDRYLADPRARREVAARGRAAVLARHTFAHRAAELLRLARPLLDAHHRGIGPGTVDLTALGEPGGGTAVVLDPVLDLDPAPSREGRR